MRRFALLLVPAALGLAACNGASPGTSPSPGDASAPSSSSPIVAASAAQPARRPPPTREGGTLVRDANGEALFVADEDHGVIRRVPLPFDPAASVVTVALPGLPAQVLALEDRVLVTVRSEGGRPIEAPMLPADPSGKPARRAPPDPKVSRAPVAPTGAGLLLIFKRDPVAGLVETARVELPADAWGLAVTPDEKTALVSSAWTHQVSAVDLATAKRLWSIDVPREPRAIVVRPDGASAYVTHLVGGVVTRIDDLTHDPRAHRVALPPSPLRSPSGKTLDGTLAYSATMSPDGGRFFVARHALGALGEAAWFGAATVDVLVTADDSPLAPLREAGAPNQVAEIVGLMRKGFGIDDRPFPRVSQAPFAEPRAMIYRKRTSTLLVASEGTNRVVELDARAIDPTMFVRQTIKVGRDPDQGIPVDRVGGAPSGLALSADESTLWVHCRSTSDLIEIRLDPPAPAPPSADAKKPPPRLELAKDLLGDPDARGRRMFYDATDRITSGGVSCAGCHPEGRDDGHVWHETKFSGLRLEEATNFLGDGDEVPRDQTARVGYARQTPMLAGRLASAGPYGWHAESADLQARLMAGFRLHRWGPLDLSYGDGELRGRAQYLQPFLRHGLAPPPRDVHPERPDEARGKEIFLSKEAQCVKCHVPATEYTDRVAYPFSPRVAAPSGFEEEKDGNYKTPSLAYVGGTAPYFHDGRASSLEVLIEQNGDRMGHTSQLSPADRAALVAFLRTL
jgi:DNA-binding beta-propeller fold protein YncE/mono/diheme cytochrome c family protein